MLLKVTIAVLLGIYIVARLIFISKKRGIKAMFTALAVLLVGGCGGLALLIFFMQPKLLYYPLRDMTASPGELGYNYENVFFTTADGVKLNGWYTPASSSGEHLTVLFCHGNGGNISYYFDTMSILYKMNVNCFLFDYRGYGLSEGRPTEGGTYSDALAAYQWLVGSKGIDPNKIVVFGRSLGGCIAAELAGKVPTAGLWLESAFTSYADMARYHYPYLPMRWLCRYRYDTIACLQKVRCPTLVIHSPDDEIVPFAMGRSLYEAAAEPKKFVQITGSHNEGFIDSGQQYTSEVSDWLEGLSKAGSLRK